MAKNQTETEISRCRNMRNLYGKLSNVSCTPLYYARSTCDASSPFQNVNSCPENSFNWQNSTEWLGSYVAALLYTDKYNTNGTTSMKWARSEPFPILIITTRAMMDISIYKYYLITINSKCWSDKGRVNSLFDHSMFGTPREKPHHRGRAVSIRGHLVATI